MRALFPLFLAGSLVSLSGCADLDISHESAVDFSKYRTVSVEVQSGYLGNDDATSYLIQELNDVSGFDKAVPVGTTADLRLEVWVSVSAYQDSDGYIDYQSDAHYKATTPNGDTLVDDRLSDSSSFPGEAEEDALDEVARVFIPPYDY